LVPAEDLRWLIVVAEHARHSALGWFTQRPVDAVVVTTAVLDDTCGNLIQPVGG